MNSKIKTYGISGLLICLLLLGAFFFKDRLSGSSDSNITDRIMYAELATPPGVNIRWKPMGYLFVGSKDRQQLFAYGNGSKRVNDAWMRDGINYEFRLYEDQDAKKPIAELFFIKEGNKIEQHTVDLTTTSTATPVTSADTTATPIPSEMATPSTAPAPSATPAPGATPNTNQSGHTKNHKHKDGM